MPLNIPRNYADGSILFKADLDAAFDAVESLVNDDKLGTEDIQAGGVEASNIAASAVTTEKLAAQAVTLAKLAQEVVDKLVPTGSLQAYAGTTAPSGWLLCDGSQVSRTVYAALYAVTGNAFGSGNGSTTFHLPDMRGRFPRGRDGGAGRDPDAASRTASNSGGNTADTVGSVQGDEFETHSHGSNTPFFVTQTGGPGIIAGGALFGAQSVTADAGGSSETRPKNINVNYIIKI